jgi:hypothetical protein
MILRKSRNKFILRLFFFVIALFLTHLTYAQTQRLSGTVKDAVTGESLIGANIIYAPGKGAVADLNGNFEFQLAPGNYEIHVSFIGYNEFIQVVNLGDKAIHMEVLMESIELDEVFIIADIARERSTPIAFSSVSAKQITEEQGTQDLPMLLNYTPGVYATQSGGGDGDARINIRGFDQRNMAVMIDGIPVNDMENGWVYWSNWTLPTKTMQVQRGLSASKLALPSVGGTINVLTIGIDQEASIQFKQDFASGNYTRSMLTLNTGRLKGDWGLVFNASYRKGNGIVDELSTEGFAYFIKAEKFWGNHRVSLSAFGAPQQHEQRKYKSEIPLYSTELAEKTGIADSVINTIPEMGILYNEFWGSYQSYNVIGNGVANNPLNPNILTYVDSTILEQGSIQKQSVAKNYFHKPMFNIRDFWTINNKLFWVNTVYFSFGRGGGTGLNSNSTVGYTADQQRDLQSVYFGNRINKLSQGFDDTFRTIDTNYSYTEYKGSNYIRSSVNNHNWFGGLSHITYKFKPQFTFSGGIDLRAYKGIHYREIYDLMGADYIVENSNENQSGLTMKKVGDKVYYYDEALVRWAGVFGQLEYTNGLLSVFANLTGSISDYKGIDYYRVEQENGEPYQTDWQKFYAFTAKLGANYNLNENMSVFFNTGYLRNAPKFNSVININNDLIENPEYEKVTAFELGYAMSSRTFSVNVNAYVTNWNNRPINRFYGADLPQGAVIPGVDPEEIDSNQVDIFIKTMDALHIGIEFDAAWVFHPKWKAQMLFSLGDWTWQSQEEAEYVYGNIIPITNASGDVLTEQIDVSGVHVGDAAQFQVGGMLEFLPSKNSYVRARYTFFGKNFSNFDPGSLIDENGGRDSWQIPNYQLIDFFAGYRFKLNKGSLNFGIVVNNVLNTVYISDAQNNDPFKRFVFTNNFDAASATIFPGLPRRYSLSITLDL